MGYPLPQMQRWRPPFDALRRGDFAHYGNGPFQLRIVKRASRLHQIEQNFFSASQHVPNPLASPLNGAHNPCAAHFRFFCSPSEELNQEELLFEIE